MTYASNQSTFLKGAIIAVCLMYTGFASAHATGRSYEKVEDGFKVDIGYPDVASAGDSSWLDFSIAPVAMNEKKRRYLYRCVGYCEARQKTLICG